MCARKNDSTIFHLLQCYTLTATFRTCVQRKFYSPIPPNFSLCSNVCKVTKRNKSKFFLLTPPFLFSISWGQWCAWHSLGTSWHQDKKDSIFRFENPVSWKMWIKVWKRTILALPGPRSIYTKNDFQPKILWSSPWCWAQFDLGLIYSRLEKSPFYGYSKMLSSTHPDIG